MAKHWGRKSGAGVHAKVKKTNYSVLTENPATSWSFCAKFPETRVQGEFECECRCLQNAMGGVSPGVISVTVAVKLVRGFEVERALLKLLQKGLLGLHHGELRQKRESRRSVGASERPLRAAMLRWRHLIFSPQQIHTSAVNGRADEVQAVVGDAEVKVAEAEDEPAERRGWSLTLPWPWVELVGH